MKINASGQLSSQGLWAGGRSAEAEGPSEVQLLASAEPGRRPSPAPLQLGQATTVQSGLSHTEPRSGHGPRLTGGQPRVPSPHP